MKERQDKKNWGKDHWSLLGYVETRCIDNDGKLGIAQMRCNEQRHPIFKSTPIKWEDSYSTIIKEGTIKGHDDWDCLQDLEDVGFIEILSFANGFVKLTEQGKKIAAQLRSHKADGGQFGNFIYS
jgi:hypothetical protein